MENDNVINGYVEDIIYYNSDNGYTVLSLNCDNEEVVCVGYLPKIHQGESLRLTGSYVVHSLYGRQFKIEYYEKSIPTTEEGIEKYLASGLVKGIGPKTAKKIVKKFGVSTSYIIEEKPEKLTEIKGISLEKAMDLNRIFTEQRELRKTVVFLQDIGISPTVAMKIYKKYKGATYKIVNENPYRLADDIWGIGFRIADKIAEKLGIYKASPDRIKSGIKYVLNAELSNGHVYLPKEILIEKCSSLLEVDISEIDNYIKEMQINHQIWIEKKENDYLCYLNQYYYAELSVAKRIIEISREYEDINTTDVELKIKRAEKHNGIALAENQKEAVREAMKNGLLVITGGPGTGKTTTINTIISLFKDEDLDVVLAAPTGRAAKRMSEATKMEAQTLHRLLGINYISEENRTQTFDKNEDNPIEADVIIVDETSMVDLMLMNYLLRAIAPGTHLILVGDVDQLPSVGAGNVLKDIINSEKVKVVRLNEIFRQAQESAIIMNAHRINNGENPIVNEKDTDFFFVKRANQEDVANTIIELVMKRLPSFVSIDSFFDIQILCPSRKGITGISNLNTKLQDALNPPQKDKKEKSSKGVVLREGDKVMQIKNNYNISWKIYNSLNKVLDEGVGVFNGDQGRIKQIDDFNEEITVIFDDGKVVKYDYTQTDELELAYAVTIHKSQGSEYPVVIIPVHSGPPMLMSRNLLYTAVTRAKKLVVIVGIMDTVSAMVKNNHEINRFTGLSDRISSVYDFMYGEDEKE